MPADTRKRLIDDIRTSLLEITTGNGFHQTVKAVLKRAKNTEVETPASYPMIWMEIGSESSPHPSYETTGDLASSFIIDLVLGLNPPQNNDHLDDIEDFIRDVKAKLYEKPRRIGLEDVVWSVVVAVGEPIMIINKSYVEATVSVETVLLYNPADP